MSSAGSTDDFAALVAEHGPGVALVCKSILRSEDLASDAAQETFVRLWQRCERGEKLERAGAWLQRVALTTALDVARRNVARRRAEDEHSVPSDAPAPSAASPLARASQAELEEALERALAQLPEGQRVIFLLRHRGGLALAEIAGVLEVAVPTVKTQFARACVRLQEKLARFAERSE